MEYSFYAVQIDDKKVRLDDMSIGFWESLAKDDEIEWQLVLTGPMRWPQVARRVAIEGARLVGKENPNLFIDDLILGPYGEPSLGKLGDLFVPVAEDLPDVDTPDPEGESVPSSGDDPSTPT